VPIAALATALLSSRAQHTVHDRRGVRRPTHAAAAVGKEARAMEEVLELQKIPYEESDELCWSTNSDCQTNSCNTDNLYPAVQEA
jgi:hypothetical protein